MNKNQFIQYINNPDLLNNMSILEISELVREYPYFQTARLLYIKNLKILEDIKFENQLKITAAHVSDRKVLYHLLHKNPERSIYIDGVEAYSPIIDKQEPNKTNPIELENIPVAEQIINHQEELLKESVSSTKPEENTNLSVADMVMQRIKEFQNPIKSEENIADIILKQAEEFKKEKNQLQPQLENFEITKNSFDFSQTNDEKTTELQEKNTTSEDQFNAKILDEELSGLSDWIEIQKNKNTNSINETNAFENKPLNQNDLIENFIQFNPRIERPTFAQNDEIIDISEPSTLENEEILSETLAQIYLSQRHYNKAINAFEKLSLKYPEKNSYFATQIEKIKELINNH